MSGRSSRRRAPLIVVLMLVGALIPGGPAGAVTRTQVDRACATSQAALAEYREAQASFQVAADAYDLAALEVENVLHRQERAADTLDIRQADMEGAQDRFEKQAVEAYMNGGGADPTLFFLAGSLDEIMTTTEFLSAAAADEQDAASELAALQGELTTLQGQLLSIEEELREVEADRLEAKELQESAMLSDQAAWEKLSGQCRELQKQYEIQVAREAAARSGPAAGLSAGATPGFRCPFPGSSFTNSWGAPRSGGRTHKGTDMMGAYGAPIYAVASGTAYTASGGLGGKTLWLVSDYGAAFYYAHLSGFNVNSGATVSVGDVVAFNGNSGNAAGGAPHVHFQIHPGGRSSAPVNPYPTLVGACR